MTQQLLICDISVLTYDHDIGSYDSHAQAQLLFKACIYICFSSFNIDVDLPVSKVFLFMCVQYVDLLCGW